MLQLNFTPQLGLDGRTLTLVDNTPAYDATRAPGGYGGPNPLRADLVLLAVVGQQQPGSLRYVATLYENVGAPLTFSLPSDGLFEACVLAVLTTTPLAPSAGQLWQDAAQGLLIQTTSGQAEPFVFSAYSYSELRGHQPPLLPNADWTGSVLAAAGAQRRVDELLLSYVRVASRNRPQGGYDYGQLWLQAQATLDSVGVLHRAGRLPEAAQQLAGLGALIYQNGQPTQLLRAQHTDWIDQQNNPTI